MDSGGPQSKRSYCPAHRRHVRPGRNLPVAARCSWTKDAELEASSLSSLSEEAQTVHRLLSGVDLQEAQALIDSLPESTLATLASISPKTTVNKLKARVLIMHDREDHLVPSAEIATTG